MHFRSFNAIRFCEKNVVSSYFVASYRLRGRTGFYTFYFSRSYYLTGTVVVIEGFSLKKGFYWRVIFSDYIEADIDRLWRRRHSALPPFCKKQSRRVDCSFLPACALVDSHVPSTSSFDEQAKIVEVSRKRICVARVRLGRVGHV